MFRLMLFGFSTHILQLPRDKPFLNFGLGNLVHILAEHFILVGELRRPFVSSRHATRSRRSRHPKQLCVDQLELVDPLDWRFRICCDVPIPQSLERGYNVEALQGAARDWPIDQKTLSSKRLAPHPFHRSRY